MIRSTLLASGAALSLGLFAAAPASAQQADIVDTAIAAGNFTTLVAAVEAADLVDTLKGEGPFTLFAPTDAAFAALPAGAVEQLLMPENQDQLVALLTHHVVSGALTSADLAGQEASVETVNGDDITVNAADSVMVGAARVTTADIAASNGVIHVIDAVMLPE